MNGWRRTAPPSAQGRGSLERLSRPCCRFWKQQVHGHLTVILEASDGKYYALDNARRIDRKPIGLAGPFDEVRDLMLKLGCC